MGVFILLSAACLAALPVIGAWYAGVELVAPVVWRIRLLRQGAQAPALLLPAGTESKLPLAPTKALAIRQLINEATGNFYAAGARDFVVEGEGPPRYVRTQARFVDAQGHPAGIPYTLDEQNRTQSVVVTWLVVDLRDTLSARVLLHIELGRQERDFGDDDLVAALLSGTVKSKLQKGDRILISEGFVVLESPFLLSRGASLTRAVEAMSDLSGRLSSVLGSDGRPRVSELLVHNLKQDRSTRVRAAAADRLLQNHADLADWTAAQGLADPQAEVRFATARHLGEEGFDIIVDVALADDEVPDGLRQRALRFLMREFSVKRVIPVLQRAIREGPDTLRLIAMRQAGAVRLKVAIPWIAEAIPFTKEPDTLVAGCEALARLGGRSAEGALVSLLNSEEKLVVRAAVEALAPIGTIASVAALTRVAETTTDREIKLSATTTIAIVQTRGAPEVLGALSLADRDLGGELSLGREDEA